MFPVHVLVALAFIPNPENKPFVNHIDGNKHNNKVSNLEWVTAKENTAHAINTGLMVVNRGEKSHLSKYSDNEIENVCILLSEGISCKKVSDMLNISLNVVKKIHAGKCWTHISNKYVFPNRHKYEANKKIRQTIEKLVDDGLTDSEIYDSCNVRKNKKNV